MSSDLSDSSLDYNTYELMAEVNYYTRPNKYCAEYSTPFGVNPGSDAYAFNECFQPVVDPKHTGVYEKEPTLIFYLERRPRRGGLNSVVTAPNRSGYFLAVDESGDFVLVGTGAANGEVTSGSSKVSFDDITGSFPKIAYDGSSDSDLNNYDPGDDECDAPRPILKFGTGEPITDHMIESRDWRYISGLSCEDPFNSDTIWTNTSVFSGFDSYIKSKLTTGARLADLTDVFGADHTVDETTIPGYHVCHKRVPEFLGGGEIETSTSFPYFFNTNNYVRLYPGSSFNDLNIGDSFWLSFVPSGTGVSPVLVTITGKTPGHTAWEVTGKLSGVIAGGYEFSFESTGTSGYSLVYKGTSEDDYSEPSIGDETGFSGVGAFHYLSTSDQNTISSTPYSKLVTKAGQSDFYYIGSKYIHNNWTVSMQGCMDLPESKVAFEKITEIYDSGTTASTSNWGHSFPLYDTEPLANQGFYSDDYRPHFEPHLNDAYRETNGATLPDPSLCQKVKNLYSGRKLELDSSLSGKMINLFVRAYKDQYSGDFTGGRTTGDLVQWLTDSSGFYNVSLNDYENSRCCSGTTTITGYSGVSCSRSISGAYVTASGTGCVETGSKLAFYDDCTGIIRATVSGDLYWTGGYAPSNPQKQIWNYDLEVFDDSGDSLGKAAGNNQNITSNPLTGSGVLSKDSTFIKTTLENDYSGVFGWSTFLPADSNFTGYYNLNCPGKHDSGNCFNINNTSYRCDTGNNSGYNSTDGFTGDSPATWGTSGMSYVLNMFSVDGSGSGCCGCSPVGATGPSGPSGPSASCTSGEPDAVFTGTLYGYLDFCDKMYKRTGVNLSGAGYTDSFNNADMYIKDCANCYNLGSDSLPPDGCTYIILQHDASFGFPFVQWEMFTKGSTNGSLGELIGYGPADYSWNYGQPTPEPTGIYSFGFSTVGTLSYDTGASICSSQFTFY